VEKPQNLDFSAYLNVKNAIMPAFGESGERLLFLTDITGTYQVWSVSTGDRQGWPEQLTFFDDRVTGLFPSPDRSKFLITRDRGGDEQDQFYLLEGDAVRGVIVNTLLDTPEYKNNFGAWRADGKAYCFSSNRRHKAFFDIYTQEVGGEPVRVYQSDETFYADDWSPDGRYLLVRRANTNLDFDLFLLDLQEPGAPLRHLTPHTGQGYFAYGTFSPDGQYIYLLSNAGREYANPARIEIASGMLEYLLDKPQDCESYTLSPDGKRLAYELNHEGYSRLFVIELKSGQERELPGLPKGVALGVGLFESYLAWSPDSAQLAFSFSTPARNANIHLWDTRSQEPARQVTFSPGGGLNFGSFVEPELIHYPTFDGLDIPALLYLPQGAQDGEKRPFILFVHGGPEGQTRFSWNPVIQYYVARGYGLLAPNVRGSSGYGKTYIGLDDVRKRMDSVSDLKAAAEWLAQSGYCDPSRIAVYGQSYGGFMVLSAVTVYPELWAAGVDIYGIANMLTFMENTSPYRLKLRTPEYGDPLADRDFLIEISAIHKVDRITAPMMVVHGARDPRVPLVESEQIVEALRTRQHPVEFIVMPDEGHGITRLQSKLAVYPAVGDFLDRYLRPGEVTKD
jgi:dipeptidyl aminopeptidase/acylaminoacyl peptidase